MKSFLCKDFLLNSDAARHLYHDYAADMPIYDYHCHLNPREIAEDRRFDDLGQIWLEGDHYKWRAMRSAGIPEALITGKTVVVVTSSMRGHRQSRKRWVTRSITGPISNCAAPSVWRVSHWRQTPPIRYGITAMNCLPPQPFLPAV